MFRDRMDAGRQLAARLAPYKDDATAIVLGIPRGGVVLGAVVAEELHVPLDVVVVRKIGAPGNPEYAVGAMDEDGKVVRSRVAPVSEAYLERAAAEDREEIGRRVREYRGGRDEPQLAGKTAILVDDGIATGLTALAAVRYVRDHGAARVVLATPVIARQSSDELRSVVDELVAVDEPASFYAVGQFYEIFDQTSDAEVRRLLSRATAGA